MQLPREDKDTETRDILHWSLRHKEHIQEFDKIKHQFTQTFSQGKSLSGQSNSIFVGAYGYPKVNIGVLTTQQYDHHEDVQFWKQNNYVIPQIVAKRVSLLNASIKSDIKDRSNLTQELQLIALSKNPVDTTVEVNKVPPLTLSSPIDVVPHGPRSGLDKLKTESEPKLSNVTERVYADTDLKASDAINMLSKTADEQFMTQALSSGSIGVGDNRKIVPTRWSITAVDDTVGKQQLDRIRTYDTAPTQVLHGNYLGNYCLVILFEGLWSYELFEMHESGARYTTDYEPLNGRTTYAEQCAGGYYASRHAVSEYLDARKKQAASLVLRIITNEYEMPLGVWVFREAMRNAMLAQPIVFNDRNLALAYSKQWFKKKFNYDVSPQLHASKMLQAGTQSSLRMFE